MHIRKYNKISLQRSERIACRVQGSETRKSSPASCSSHELLPFKSTKIRSLRVKESFPLFRVFLNSKALKASAHRWIILKIEKFSILRGDRRAEDAGSYLAFNIHEWISRAKQNEAITRVTSVAISSLHKILIFERSRGERLKRKR